MTEEATKMEKMEQREVESRLWVVHREFLTTVHLQYPSLI